MAKLWIIVSVLAVISLTSAEDPKVTEVIDGHVFKCYNTGKFPHPVDSHKYVICEFIAEGSNKGWWIHIMSCAPKTKWSQTTQNCVQEEEEEKEVKVTKMIDGHLFKCLNQGKFEHPIDSHKYVICEHILEGTQKGWWIHIMSCAPGTKWSQSTQTCVEE